MSAAGFRVEFNPVPTANRVAVARSRLVRWVWLSLVVAGGAWALYAWDPTTRSLGWWATAVVVALLVLVLLGRTVVLARARSQLARIGAGAALEADHRGLLLHGLDGSTTRLAWHEVERVRAAVPLPGAEPVLQVTGTGQQQWQVPLSQLASLPGGIDAGLRACSGGQVGVDVSALDSLL